MSKVIQFTGRAAVKGLGERARDGHTISFKLFLIWTFVLIGRPQDLWVFLQPLRPAILLGMLTVAAVMIRNGESLKGSLVGSHEARRYLMFFLVLLIGIPFAYHRRVAFDFIVFKYLMNLVFFFTFIVEVDSISKLKSVITTLCLAATFYAGFGLAEGTLMQGRFFSYGAMFDPNDMAYVLVTLGPMALPLIGSRNQWPIKLLGLGTIGASVIFILLTGSRAGILGLGVFGLLVFFSGVAQLSLWKKIVLAIVVVGVVGVYGSNINIDRYLTLTNVSSDYNVSDEMGRLSIWQRGLELFLSNPATGVGVGCFPMAIGYLRDAADILPKWQAPHNSFLQIAVETGVVGSLLFVGLGVSCIRTFSVGRKLQASSVEGKDFKDIAGSLQVGFLGHFICAFFVSQGYSMFFTLFFALSAVLGKLQGQMAESEMTTKVVGWGKGGRVGQFRPAVAVIARPKAPSVKERGRQWVVGDLLPQ